MDDTYGFDDNTDLYDPNMDVSIDETDRLIEDMERVQGNFEDALTIAQKWFKHPFVNSSANEESAVRVEMEDIPAKAPNNTKTDLTDSNSESFGIRMNVSYVICIIALVLVFILILLFIVLRITYGPYDFAKNS